MKALWTDVNSFEHNTSGLYFIGHPYKNNNFYLFYKKGDSQIILKKLGEYYEDILIQCDLLQNSGLIEYHQDTAISIIPADFFRGCSIQQVYDVLDDKISVNDVKRNHSKMSQPSNNPATNDRRTSSNKQSSGGCYIATCVYGSYDCPEVWTLRRYRDQVLRNTVLGRAFIKVYYATSPTLVKWFGSSRFFLSFWRRNLDKLVIRLHRMSIDGSPYIDV